MVLLLHIFQHQVLYLALVSVIREQLQVQADIGNCQNLLVYVSNKIEPKQAPTTCLCTTINNFNTSLYQRYTQPIQLHYNQTFFQSIYQDCGK